MLGSLGLVDGASVLDLFAGSGALGIEALSRGAAEATFVERDPDALRAIRANLETTGLGPARVVKADVHRFLEAADRFDLAFCDPPYGFVDWDDLLGRLQADTVLVESDREIVPGPGWRVLRTRRHGGTVVVLIVKAGRPSCPTPPER